MTTMLKSSTQTAPPAHEPSSPARPARSSKTERPWKRIIIDSVLLATFILSLASLALGNILWHVVAGTSFAVAAVAHLSLQWKWVRGVAKRRRTVRGRARKNVIVDSILTIAGIAIIVSGPALWAEVLAPLGALHGPAVALLMVAIPTHLVLHRLWIKRAALGPAKR